MDNKNQKQRILIIEDNPDLEAMFAIAFGMDFEVDSSEDGIRGIAKAAEFKPDLILLDLMMPQMDGYEVLQALKNNSALQSIVVINSNLTSQKDIDKAFEMGADFFFKKSDHTPFQIVEKVKDILKKKDSGELISKAF